MELHEKSVAHLQSRSQVLKFCPRAVMPPLLQFPSHDAPLAIAGPEESAAASAATAAPGALAGAGRPSDGALVPLASLPAHLGVNGLIAKALAIACYRKAEIGAEWVTKIFSRATCHAFWITLGTSYQLMPWCIECDQVSQEGDVLAWTWKRPLQPRPLQDIICDSMPSYALAHMTLAVTQYPTSLPIRNRFLMTCETTDAAIKTFDLVVPVRRQRGPQDYGS